MENVELATLSYIAWQKSLLPLQLRGWVNVLGLHVQEREAGRWRRLQAGGKFRSCLDAWCEGEGDWQVKKFDKDTWERRFAHLIEPTLEIADFLNQRRRYLGNLDREGEDALKNAIQHFMDTDTWPGLPRVSEEVIHKWEQDEAKARAQERQDERTGKISAYEKRIKDDPLDMAALGFLQSLYYEEQRYKDLENVLKMSLRADTSNWWFNNQQLGKTYLAALSVSIRGKGIPIWGWEPSNVAPEALGYTIEELRTQAKENLGKAYEMMKEAGFEGEELKELEIAIKATNTLSTETFEEFDRFKDEEKQREEEEMQKDVDEDLDEDLKECL